MGRAGMAFQDRLGELSLVADLDHGLVTHGVLGVFEAATFVEDILSYAHPCRATV